MSTGSRHSRHRAREFALQAIYQWLLSGNSQEVIEAHFAQVSGFERAHPEFFHQLVDAVLHHASELRDAFSPFLSRLVSEISPVEHAILLIATEELRHSPETPARVILNEAIELAKAYGATDGHKFINGVLDKLAAHLRPHELGS